MTGDENNMIVCIKEKDFKDQIVSPQGNRYV